MILHTEVQAALVELFMEVADACDAAPVDKIDVQTHFKRIQSTYEDIMKRRKVLDFYGELVDKVSKKNFNI